MKTGTTIDNPDRSNSCSRLDAGLCASAILADLGLWIEPDHDNGWTNEEPWPWKMTMYPLPHGSELQAVHDIVLRFCEENFIRTEFLSERAIHNSGVTDEDFR